MKKNKTPLTNEHYEQYVITNTKAKQNWNKIEVEKITSFFCLLHSVYDNIDIISLLLRLQTHDIHKYNYSFFIII